MEFQLSRTGLLAAAMAGLFLVSTACSDNTIGDDATQPPADSAETRGPGVANGDGATPEETEAEETQGVDGDALSTTEIVDMAGPSVVRVAAGPGVGSGFIIDESGLIITNNHVIAEAPGQIEVTLADGATHPASLVGTDPGADIAVLQVDTGQELPALALADLDNVLVGEPVVAIGYALDLGSGRGDPTVTLGIVSAKNRPINDSGILGAVQTDAAINHGNSGGPLINFEGKVVGVNTAIAPATSGSGAAQNIGFAVGSDAVNAVYDEILQKGSVERAYLGIAGFSSLRAAQAEALGIPEEQPGIFVPNGGVEPGGPADEAGLLGEDVIVAIDGVEIGNESDLWVSMIRHDPGETVEVEIYRDGDLMRLDLTLGANPFTTG